MTEAPGIIAAEAARLGWLTVGTSDLLQEADNFNPWTPSSDVRRLIASALNRAPGPGVIRALCGRIADRTRISEEAVLEQALMISRNFRLRAPDGATQLARRVLSALFGEGTALVSTVRGDFHGYDGRLWRPLPDLELERLLLEWTLAEADRSGRRWSHQTVRATIRFLKALQTRPTPWEARPPCCVVNTLAGELWIATGGEPELRPHRPESGLRALVPVRYDPQATCPQFDRALAGIFAGAADASGMTRHMLEVMGYAIQPKRDIPAIICLVGGGANGKTSLLSLLQTLVGADQVYAGSGGALADRFTLPNLSGRLLYVDDDLSEGARLNDGLLKQMAEDKLMTARRAHAASSITFRASALPILAMNGAPRLNDSSYGLQRRLFVIPFERQFAPQEQDARLFDQIRSQELPGVLNRCLEGLQRLRARGRFDEPAECLQAKAEWLEGANPLQGFLADACRPYPKGRVALGDLHAAMASWCRVEKLPLRHSRRTLARQLRSAGYRVEKIAGLARVMGLDLVKPDAGAKTKAPPQRRRQA